MTTDPSSRSSTSFVRRSWYSVDGIESLEISLFAAGVEGNVNVVDAGNDDVDVDVDEKARRERRGRRETKKSLLATKSIMLMLMFNTY